MWHDMRGKTVGGIKGQTSEGSGNVPTEAFPKHHMPFDTFVNTNITQSWEPVCTVQ